MHICSENAKVRSKRTSPGDGSVRAHRPSRRQLLEILWKHAAAITLSLPLVAPPLSLAGLVTLESCGPSPPGGSGGNMGGANHGRWDGNSSPSTSSIYNEIAQLATSGPPITLTLSSFAVTRKAYGKIVRKFVHEYENSTGRKVRFRLTFGGSGTQARAIIDGLPADMAALAVPLDILKIEEAGLVSPGWNQRFPNHSVICESVVTIVTRAGNPKGIKGWEDLARGDIEVVVANPKTAGVARWIFLALWGHKLGHGEAAAKDYVTKVFDNVEIMPRDAREASDVFYTQKFGDALLTYENEALFTNMIVSPKNPLPYISPDNNVRITCPAALIERNLASRPPEAKQAAEAFVKYLFTPEAQREFVACGFRTVNKEAAGSTNFRRVNRLWEVEKRLGNWKTVEKKFFDERGILTAIMNDVSQRKLQARLAARDKR